MAEVLQGRKRDLGSVHVVRMLPLTERKMVGPFIFLDHIQKTVLAEGAALDVRPHPHINLATVTYLFEGVIEHRDSLGSHQPIRPGAINWMTAGRGIVHSERTPKELRAAPSPIHGLQFWVALPTRFEEVEPAFIHYPKSELPVLEEPDRKIAVLAGSAYGLSSPVKTFSPLFFVDVVLAGDAELSLPEGHEERAAYVVEGQVTSGSVEAAPGQMVVFGAGERAALVARGGARLALIGGAPLDGPRLIYWNFVSSSKERLEKAKRDWREGRFPKVPGDDQEFIPLPDDA